MSNSLPNDPCIKSDVGTKKVIAEYYHFDDFGAVEATNISRERATKLRSEGYQVDRRLSNVAGSRGELGKAMLVEAWKGSRPNLSLFTRVEPKVEVIKG